MMNSIVNKSEAAEGHKPSCMICLIQMSQEKIHPLSTPTTGRETEMCETNGGGEINTTGPANLIPSLS